MFGNLVEQTALLALVRASEGTISWSGLATVVETVGSAVRILRGERSGLDDEDASAVDQIAGGVTSEDLTACSALIEELTPHGVELFTVLDAGYPANLREVYDRPPFLFVRGDLLPQDSRSVAVVGTRRASEEGVAMAKRIAAELAERQVTVVSGLAAGIDTAAHSAALDAGGRTIAVYGTGIHRVHPAANRQLAERVVTSGAVVSQFWPDAPPTRITFPMRNVVTSGLSIGTVVVQADGRSGARNQARRCLEHGKRLFLVESLVLHEDWARRYAERPGATVVRSVDDILSVLTEVIEAPRQLSLM